MTCQAGNLLFHIHRVPYGARFFVDYNIFMEDTYFQEFKKQSDEQLAELHPSDIVPFMGEPVPDNYTIVVRPSPEIAEAVHKLTDEFRQIDTGQFYYAPRNLHMTIYGGVPMDLPLEEFIARTAPVIANYRMKFSVKGLGSNGYCSSVHLFPDGFSVHQLREQLRTAVGHHGQRYDSILSRYEYVGWMNYLRYTRTPEPRLIELLKLNRDRDFGQLEYPRIELYKATSKVLNYLPGDESLYTYTQ